MKLDIPSARCGSFFKYYTWVLSALPLAPPRDLRDGGSRAGGTYLQESTRSARWLAGPRRASCWHAAEAAFCPCSDLLPLQPSSFFIQPAPALRLPTASTRAHWLAQGNLPEDAGSAFSSGVPRQIQKRRTISMNI